MQLTNTSVIVTGGAGFIGSHVVDVLARQGNDVTVIDDLSIGSKENLEDHLGRPGFELVEVDICDPDAMHAHVRDADVVIHMAIGCLRRSLARPVEVHEINTTGTINVCQAALDNGVRRVLNVSSSEGYGTAQVAPMDESHPLEPITVYGASKAAGEMYALAYGRTYGLETSSVRPFNSYGPREPHLGERAEVIPKFALRIMAGERPVVFGDGSQTRDFTWVEETAAGIVAAAGCDDLVGRSVNLARGVEVSIREIAVLLARALDRPDLVPLIDDGRPGDVDRHHADTRLAADLLGWNPTVSIEEGLGRYVTWLRSTGIDAERWLAAEQLRNW